ncbi:MAG: class I adenylate-forming enzyme family protein, partial [Actinomycetota bacterium]
MNLAELIEKHVSDFGDYDSLWFEGRWHTTGEIATRARKVGAGLQELGLEPGDRVAVMLPNCPEVLITYWGSWRVGAAVTPIVFLLPPPEINRILSHSRARFVVTSAELLPSVQAGAHGVDTLERIIMVGDAAEGTTPFSDLERAGEADLLDRDPSDLAALLFTGGTTGASKGVMLSHNNLNWMAEASIKASEVKHDEMGLATLPLSHSFGLGVAVIGTHVKGRAIMLRWFDPTASCELIQKFEVSRTAVVPTMLQMMLAAPLEDFDLSSLHYIVSGAAALPDEILRAWEQRVPSSKLLQGYGLSETSPTISVQPPSSADGGTRKIGSVGRPLPGLDVRIVDGDGEVLGPDEVGEITVKGPNVTLGYWDNDQATSDAIRDGYFHTGDMGKLDTDGDLFIVDRKKDLIKTSGYQVWPREVEEALASHPAVAEV